LETVVAAAVVGAVVVVVAVALLAVAVVVAVVLLVEAEAARAVPGVVRRLSLYVLDTQQGRTKPLTIRSVV
jgi:hypothetical protein